MLRRDRQLRIQVYQFIDGGLFALALYLGWWIRFHWKGLPWFGLDNVDKINGFGAEYFWLFLVVIPMTPVILDWQGYYERPIFSPRRLVFWQLGKACLIATVGLILIQFMLRREGARGVFVLFGLLGFGLMMVKEEILRWAYQTQFGQAQFKRRIILVGAEVDTQSLRATIGSSMGELQIIGVFDLNQCTIEDLVSFLHEHSVNMVLIHANHTAFGQVERAINACELEGI
jgi:FlaA1/EpsC-like NDP-sugar epimerase